MTDTNPLDRFTTRIDVHPAYDHRDEPGGGAHGAELRLVLIGELGAIESAIGTGWVLRPLNGTLGSLRPLPNRRDKPGVDSTLSTVYPSGHGTFAHCRMPREGYADNGRNTCPLLDDAPCWTDGSYTVSDKVLAALVGGGHEAAFNVLAELYQAWIVERPVVAELGAGVA